MPKYPNPSVRAERVSAGTFGDLAPIIARKGAAGRLYPFHLGDSHLLPAEAARRIDLDTPRLHRYCPVPGMPEFRSLVAAWLGTQLGIDCPAGNAFATTGCTGALSVLTTALIDEGDEVLVVTPVWPLTLGILSARGAVPVQVPIGPDAWPECDAGDFKRRLSEACTERTAAIYFCDPNNPAGFVLPAAQMRALREVAEQHDLWLMVDVVYKDLILDGSTWHVPLLAADGGDQRLVLAGSFSKSHVLAGHRAGFAIAPEHLRRVVRGAITHTPYHASTSAQQMAVAAFGAGPQEIERVRESYTDGLAVVRETLEARFRTPQASGFVFIDLGDAAPDAVTTMSFLHSCLESDVALAPGAPFGDDFARFVRLCYTASPPEVVREGIAVLNPVLARLRAKTPAEN